MPWQARKKGLSQIRIIPALLFRMPAYPAASAPAPRRAPPWRRQAIRPCPEAFLALQQFQKLLLAHSDIAHYLLSIPRPSSSPGCTGITVLLPSVCFMKRWLPFCRTGRKPILPSALMTNLASTGFNFNDLYSYKASNGAAAFRFQIV